jgi:hypothetical protein
MTFLNARIGGRAAAGLLVSGLGWQATQSLTFDPKADFGQACERTQRGGAELAP